MQIKRILAVLTIPFISLSSWALPEINVLSFDQYVETGAGYTSVKSLEHNLPCVTMAYGFRLNDINCEFAFQSNSDTFDFSYTNHSWIITSPHDNFTINYGLFGDIHYQRYKDISSTYDMDGGFGAKWNFKDNSSCYLTCGYGIKSQHIDAVYDYVGAIYSHWISASLNYTKFWDNGCEFSFDFASHDKYRYPIFISPSYIFTFAYNFSDYRVFTSTQVRVCDEFTTAPYVDLIVFRLGLRYNF